MSNKGKLMKAGVRVRLSPRKPLVKGCFLSLRLQLVVDHLAEASASDLEPGVSPDQCVQRRPFFFATKIPRHLSNFSRRHAEATACSWRYKDLCELPCSLHRYRYFFRYCSTLLWSTTSVPVSTTGGTFFPSARSFIVFMTSIPIL